MVEVLDSLRKASGCGGEVEDLEVDFGGGGESRGVKCVGRKTTLEGDLRSTKWSRDDGGFYGGAATGGGGGEEFRHV
ncbi:hypothetical protein LguiB_021370 [Lonicera macranthoides]